MGEQLDSTITRIMVRGYKSLCQEQRIAIRPLTILAGANSSGKSSMMQPVLLLKQTLEATFDPGALLLNGPNVTFTSADQVLSQMGDGTVAETFSVGIEESTGESITIVFSRQSGKGFVLTEHASIDKVTPHIRNLIHLPGLRGNPERSYQRAATGPVFPGTFQVYTASIINEWAEQQDKQLALLNDDLSRLGLTADVAARAINDTQFELLVSRHSRASTTSERVNIADVGLGVSQTLPVLVALHTAKPGQLVYIEQPEMHLHPRAQVAMAHVLAEAARRGVRVVIETHSSLLLLAVQTLVAEGELSPDMVMLHWFALNEERMTEVRSTGLDEAGAFEDTTWPEDFGAVEMDAQGRYLDASLSRQQNQSDGARVGQGWVG